MVGGADADIILDDVIIEIKVTKHLKLKRVYLNQTIGYCILALIGGINKNQNGTIIKNIGVYFARHGFLWKIPLTEFGNLNKLQDFKKWFTHYFDKIRKEQLEEINKQLKIYSVSNEIQEFTKRKTE